MKNRKLEAKLRRMMRAMQVIIIKNEILRGGEKANVKSRKGE